ncbi:MAG: hypothetical protein ACQEUS_20850 [Bacillota bacterium]
MEIVKSLLFIIFGLVLHAYSKKSISRFPRHTYNFMILAAIVWLVSFRFFPYWNLVLLVSYIAASVSGILVIMEKVRKDQFVYPSSNWIWYVLALSAVGVAIIQTNSGLMIIAAIFAICYFSSLIYAEKREKKYEQYRKVYNEKCKNDPRFHLNERERMIERIKRENVNLVQKNSYSPVKYAYAQEINVADNVIRRNIIEPRHPEISINTQAHLLAHELGHHYDAIKRSTRTRGFLEDCKNARKFKPIAGLFVLYDELSAWKHAKQVCLEEGINTDFFDITKKVAFSTYLKAYWEALINPLKTLVKVYIFSVSVVLASVLLTDAGIHIPFGIDTITNEIANEPNRTAAVNYLFQICMSFVFLKWLLGFFWFKPTKNYQYAPEDNFILGNTGNEVENHK